MRVGFLSTTSYPMSIDSMGILVLAFTKTEAKTLKHSQSTYFTVIEYYYTICHSKSQTIFANKNLLWAVIPQNMMERLVGFLSATMSAP